MSDGIILNLGSGGDTLAADDDGTAKHQQVKVEFGGDGTFTPVTASVGLPVGVVGTVPVSNAGTFATQSAQTGTWTVQPGNTANTTPWLTTPTPATSGGLSIFRSIDLDETEEDVKTSAGQVFGWHYFNASAGTRYLKFYNATAANVTVGTTTPVITIPVATGTASNVEYSNGIAFGTAISAAVTTGLADNDTGAPAANDFIINILYK